MPTVPTNFWRDPRRDFQFRLETSDVHVWLASVTGASPIPPRLRSCLSAEELAKAGRFRSSTDRSIAVVSRGILRHLLGQYAGIPPEAVALVCNAFGKPGLADGAGEGLTFNVSHSHRWILFAFARGRQVGVDVERIRRQSGDDEWVGQYLAPAELSRLRSLPEPERVQAFFECWTRKEAFLKARGEGLTGGLDTFEVAFGRGVRPAILRVKSTERTPAADWSVVNLPLGPDYAGALVVEGVYDGLDALRWAPRVTNGFSLNVDLHHSLKVERDEG